jgi:hypothetical protein
MCDEWGRGVENGLKMRDVISDDPTECRHSNSVIKFEERQFCQ